MSAPERAGIVERLTGSARPAELGLIALRVVVVGSVIVGVPHWPDSAAHRFFEIAHAPGIPWRDTPVEYALVRLDRDPRRRVGEPRAARASCSPWLPSAPT